MDTNLGAVARIPYNRKESVEDLRLPDGRDKWFRVAKQAIGSHHPSNHPKVSDVVRAGLAILHLVWDSISDKHVQNAGCTYRENGVLRGVVRVRIECRGVYLDSV